MTDRLNLAPLKAPRRGSFWIVPALAAALFAAALSTPAVAHDKPATISISGTGTTTAVPDQAHVTSRVVILAKTAAEALSGNTAALTKVIAEIKSAGIEDKDIQTSGFAVNPRYADNKGQYSENPTIIGYEVSNGVAIRVRELDKLGALLDAMVRSGANSIGGISFIVSKADSLRDEARKKAVENAKRKATLYAEAAGVSLGRILSINEAGAAAPRRFAMRAEAVAMSPAPAPIAAGEETLSAGVTIVWELKD